MGEAHARSVMEIITKPRIDQVTMKYWSVLNGRPNGRDLQAVFVTIGRSIVMNALTKNAAILYPIYIKN